MSTGTGQVQYAGGFFSARSRIPGAFHGLRRRLNGSAPPWPTHRAGPLDDACSGFTHVADRTVASAPLRTRPLDHARGHHYRGPRRLPEPDSHRQAALNLSLGLRHDDLLLFMAPEQSGRTRRKRKPCGWLPRTAALAWRLSHKASGARRRCRLIQRTGETGRWARGRTRTSGLATGGSGAVVGAFSNADSLCNSLHARQRRGSRRAEAGSHCCFPCRGCRISRGRWRTVQRRVGGARQSGGRLALPRGRSHFGNGAVGDAHNEVPSQRTYATASMYKRPSRCAPARRLPRTSRGRVSRRWCRLLHCCGEQASQLSWPAT